MSALNWETTTKNPTTLQLDSRNPRLAQITQQSSERDLIEELVEKEDVFSLAKSISESGFFPNEALVAVRESGKTIIVEGNRRLAACKLLISPEAAPDRFKARFRTLAASTDIAQLASIPVCIAPSREATHALVLKRHTKLPISKWEPAMQAKFYGQLVQGGMSIADIAETSGQTEGEVRNSLRDYHLYEMACRLDLPSDVVAKVHDPHSFSLSTLGRVFDVPEARKYFGVEVDQDGNVVGKIHEDEFAKGFTQLVSDLAMGKVTSRNLNKSSDVASYLNDLPAGCKPKKRSGTFTATTFRQTSPKTDGAPAKESIRSKPLPKQSRALIPSTVGCGVQNLRVKALFTELRRMAPEKLPNACAFTLRALIEMSVFCYLNGKGEIQAMVEEYKAEIDAHNQKHPQKKKQVPPHWTPDLRAMMNRLRDPQRNLLNDGHVSKALAKAIDDEEELFGLNLCTHNPTYHPSGPNLRMTWARFEELMKILLD